MAEAKAAEENHGVRRSSTDYPSVTDPPEPGEEDSSSQSSDAPYPQDLRSVLVTSVLNLEELDVDLYRGTHHWVPRTQRLFGGQIIGQALVAAAKSVSDNLYAHSLHCYFVRAGDPKVPVLYHVDRTRDGRSFTVRSVKAIQHGQPVLICQASFQVLQPSPLQHQFTMPVVPQPEDLLTIEELIQRYLSKPDLTENAREGLNKLLANEVPIEIKPVRPAHFHRFAPGEPRRLFWARARGYIGEGNMKLHCCVAAYVSDFALLGTVLLPYSEYKAQFTASLDHAMWFHSTFRSDEWMLYDCESPWAVLKELNLYGDTPAGRTKPSFLPVTFPSQKYFLNSYGGNTAMGSSRGLAQGRLWRKDGVLAATCSQEGVLRVKPVTQTSRL